MRLPHDTLYTHKQAMERVQRGYEWLRVSGLRYDLDLHRLRDARSHIVTQDPQSCPLALALIGYQSYESAVLTIARTNRWSSNTLDVFVADHGFDLYRKSVIMPERLWKRQWKLLDRAWREVLEPEIPAEPEIGFHRLVAARRFGLLS